MRFCNLARLPIFKKYAAIWNPKTQMRKAKKSE